MDHLEALIRGRRSIGKVKDIPVPKRLIERMIDAAVWAPTHYHTEPWRFIVMTGEGRRVLGQAYADIAEGNLTAMPAEELQERLAKEALKAFRAPVVIAVICSPSDLARAVEIEELAAVHAAVQNLLLMAHASGLGAVWRTGDPTYHPTMKRALGLEEKEKLVGLIFVGYPDMQPGAAKRVPGTTKTLWLETTDDRIGK